MNFKLVRGRETLLDFNTDSSEINDENIKAIIKYNDEEVDTVSFLFREGVKVKDTKDLNEIDPKLVHSFIVKIL